MAYHMKFLNCHSQWVDLSQLPDAYPAALSLPLLDRTGGEEKKKKLVGKGKDAEISYQLPSQASWI